MGDIEQLAVNLRIEDNVLKEETLQGRGLEILMCLMNGGVSIDSISDMLDMPPFKVKLFIDRLLKNNLIKIVSNEIINGKIHYKYEITDQNLDFMGHKLDNVNEMDSLKQLISSVIDTGKEDNQCFHTKITMINGSKETIMKFLEEVEELHRKYIDIEEKDGTEIYSLITIAGEYKMEQ